MDEKITLYELLERVKKAVEGLSRSSVWITAEISEVKRNASGHWYLELADYSKEGGEVVAKAKGMIWSRSAAMLIPFFEISTGSSLKAGMHVLLKVQVQYSVMYGLSLNITDIDPSFTVGELELNRQKVIQRLQQEGMFGLNAELSLPSIIKRIAIVSSATAAGYRDFMKHLGENGYGFTFFTRLFEAPMQGDDAPSGIIEALGEIVESVQEGDSFDAVVIIRGGGGVLELACFDDYDLALTIAQFPLPVYTGIGHDHDFHVADMVAHTYFKTPTAVADHIIELNMQQAALLEMLCNRMKLALSGKINDKLNYLLRCSDRLQSAAARVLANEYAKLDLIEYKVKTQDPQHILNKGFAIVANNNGERIASVDDVCSGDSIKLIMKDGIVELSGIVIKRKFND